MSWCWSEIDHSSCSKRGRRSSERKAWKEIYNSSSIHDFFIKASDSCMMAKKGLESEPTWWYPTLPSSEMMNSGDLSVLIP
jgi:hypothetical protein